MQIFTYGTLMYPEVWHAVVGRRYRVSKATVSSYERRAVKDATFPCMIPTDDATATVSGVIYFGVSLEDMEVLDDFEADQYDREIVSCTLPDGKTEEAFTYVWSPRHSEMVGDEWDEAWFRKEGLQRFLTRYGG